MDEPYLLLRRAQVCDGGDVHVFIFFNELVSLHVCWSLEFCDYVYSFTEDLSRMESMERKNGLHWQSLIFFVG